MEIKDKILDIQNIKKSKQSLLSLFIRKTAVITSVPESLVEMIIKDQWSNANKQTRPNSTVTEIDIPNIGMFYVSKSKGLKKLSNLDRHDKLLNDSLLEEGICENKITKVNNMLLKNIEYRANINIKTKTNIKNEN